MRTQTHSNHPWRLPDLHALPRHAAVAGGVVLLHGLALWALQSSLLGRVVEVLAPAQVIAEFIEPSAPTVHPPPSAPNKVARNQPKATADVPPMPLALPDAAPTPAAPVGVATPLPPAQSLTAPVAVVAVAPAAPPASPAPPRVQLPSSNADYLQNPKPVYPSVSKRLGEQGQVIHSVRIGEDGLPISAQLVQSSGFDRLDQAAFEAVMRWRYVPGKRNGAPTAMSFNVPIVWELQ